MAEEAEPGDVGGRVNVAGRQKVLRNPVQGAHNFGNLGLNFRRGQSAFAGRGDNPGPQRFGKNKTVPSPGAGVGENPVRMNDAGNRQSVF